MTTEQGFAPVSAPDSAVLILGSMPGRQSLDQQQYYGNPHNAFWRIMGGFTGVAASQSYDEKVEGLIRSRIALWDVIMRCARPGSLDSDIDRGTIEVNDFVRFLDVHRGVEAIFFNGGRAAEEYRRRVLPLLDARCRALPTIRLLSTSPANARFSLDEKRRNWAKITPFLNVDAR